jgi:hypothetical protein
MWLERPNPPPPPQISQVVDIRANLCCQPGEASWLNDYFSIHQLREVNALERRTLRLAGLTAKFPASPQTNRYIREATHAYIKGLPLASVAMSRAALEQGLRDRLGLQKTEERRSFDDLVKKQKNGTYCTLERAWLGSQQIASWTVVVDAKMGARDFYLKHDFIPLPTQPDRLFLPMKTIEKLFP